MELYLVDSDYFQIDSSINIGLSIWTIKRPHFTNMYAFENINPRRIMNKEEEVYNGVSLLSNK